MQLKPSTKLDGLGFYSFRVRVLWFQGARVEGLEFGIITEFGLFRAAPAKPSARKLRSVARRTSRLEAPSFSKAICLQGVLCRVLI